MTPAVRARNDFRLRPHNLTALLLLCSAGWAFVAASALERRPWSGFETPPDGERVAAARERVDPNAAPVGSLRRLPGLGPTLAERVVEHRQAGGRPYRRPADLTAVRGIGRIKAERLAPHLSFGPPESD